MLQIHSKYSEVIKDIFQNDQEFLSALDKACSTAINHRANPKMPCKSPELVRFTFFFQCPYKGNFFHLIKEVKLNLIFTIVLFKINFCFVNLLNNSSQRPWILLFNNNLNP